MNWPAAYVNGQHINRKGKNNFEKRPRHFEQGDVSSKRVHAYSGQSKEAHLTIEHALAPKRTGPAYPRALRREDDVLGENYCRSMVVNNRPSPIKTVLVVAYSMCVRPVVMIPI